MEDLAAQRRSVKPKSRQSIAHIPSSKSSALKDNATTDIAALQAEHGRNLAAAKKKSRGKSIGPGGLEALTETSANAAKVRKLLKRSIISLLLTADRFLHHSRSSPFSNQQFPLHPRKQSLPSTSYESGALAKGNHLLSRMLKSSS